MPIALEEQLFREPYRFDFFQAVRLLECLADERAEDTGNRRQPVGKDNLPAREMVRFHAQPSLSFPASMIVSLTEKKAEKTRTPVAADLAELDAPLEMVVAFMGLTGPSGVLPRHYTTLLLQRLRHRDVTLRDFLDLFNHRFISFFYRAWEKYRLPFSYERSQRLGAKAEIDPCTQILYSLAGLGTAGLCDRLEIDDRSFLFYVGHLARFPRSAEALECLLEDYFVLPLRVKQFQGQWLYLSEETRSRLPAAHSRDGCNNQLGIDCVTGDRVWDLQSKFRIRLGPLDYRQFRDFIPGRPGHRRLCQMVRFYAGLEFDFDMQLALYPDEVPGSELCTLADAEPPSLGWNSWLRSGTYECEEDAAVFFEVDAFGN